MSNLKLPTMSYAALMATERLTSKPKKIAYATTAEYANGYITIRHHGNAIALIARNIIVIDNCGWDSDTTVNRLRKVMRDNNIPYYVRIRDFEMRLCNDAHNEIDGNFRTATFTRNNDVWTLQYYVVS